MPVARNGDQAIFRNTNPLKLTRDQLSFLHAEVRVAKPKPLRSLPGRSYVVKLVCGHSNTFIAVKPLPGEQVYCQICKDYSALKGKVVEIFRADEA
jgi:hypothetical protein